MADPESALVGANAGELADEAADYDDDDEYCEHDCGAEGCFEDGFEFCHHEHCMNCGGCGCPGYCDDYQTYNLRPEETGGKEEADPLPPGFVVPTPTPFHPDAPGVPDPEDVTTWAFDGPADYSGTMPPLPEVDPLTSAAEGTEDG